MKEVEQDVLDAAARIRTLEDELKATRKRLKTVEARHKNQKQVSRYLRQDARWAREDARWTREDAWGEVYRARRRASLFLEASEIYEREGMKHGWEVSDGVNERLCSIRRQIEAIDMACVCVPGRADALLRG